MTAWECDPVLSKVAGTRADTRLACGQVIDERYEIIDCLGSGGMCTVYKAQQLLLDKPCALKFLKRQLITDTTVQRFQREAVTVSSLNHPNIVSVSGFGVWNSQPYMAAELVEGVSLAQLLQQQRRLEKTRALGIFNQILDALSHAHERGIVHRDLKPSNVMIAANDSVKLVDFGIAKLLPESGKEIQKLTQTADIFGTLLYMSPEQCLGYPVDARADIYAMGCLMYEVLTGHPPLQAETPFALMHKHLTEEPADASLLDRGLAPIVMQCLEKDPQNRPQSAAALKELLACPPAAPISLTYKALKKQRRNIRRLLRVLVGLASIVVGALACIIIFRHVSTDAEPVAKNSTDDNSPGMLDDAMKKLNTEPKRAIKILDQIISSNDRSSAGPQLKAIRARFAFALSRREDAVASHLCDRYHEIIDTNFPGVIAEQVRCRDLKLQLAQAMHQVPIEKALLQEQLPLLEAREKSAERRFYDEGEILVRTYDARAELEDSAGDSRAAEQDFRRALKVFDNPRVVEGALFSHVHAGASLFEFLLRHHRTPEAHSLLLHMEASKNNWDPNAVNYAEHCLIWATQYSEIGDFKMAIEWVNRGMPHAGGKRVEFLRFRSGQYRELGDSLHAKQDLTEAALCAGSSH
ncbi:MAG TPA: serine/threonine-protein kinase [Candidatus Obscuribacterales bacterium]